MRRKFGRGINDPVVQRLYAMSGGRALWTDANARLLARIRGAASTHGLDPTAFEPKAMAGASKDEALSISALAYSKALASGFIDPRTIEQIFTLKRNDIDLAAGLVRALENGGLEAWFASLPPQDEEYQTLSKAYAAALSQTNLSGLPPSGAPVGQSMAPADQLRQLAANLERRRWLERRPPRHRIDVNTAGAFLGYFVDGRLAGSLRTVVGQGDHPTPSIEAAFHNLVANPPWRVPTEIAKREILPKGEAYMASQDMRVEDGRVVQAPGPRNALGLVKFDVEDPYDIYLHDTPAKALFAQDERHRSHGCVRLQNAVDFARAIASETGRAERFDRALASAQTTEVELGRSIGVRMLYHTAYLDQDGRVMLDHDIYGADERLAAALGLRQAVASQRPSEPDADLGP